MICSKYSMLSKHDIFARFGYPSPASLGSGRASLRKAPSPPAEADDVELASNESIMPDLAAPDVASFFVSFF